MKNRRKIVITVKEHGTHTYVLKPGLTSYTEGNLISKTKENWLISQHHFY